MIYHFTSHQIPFRVLEYKPSVYSTWYIYNVSYANGIGQNWSSRSSIQIVVQNWHLINLTSWFFFHWWHKFGHIYISKRNLFQKYAKRTWSPCSWFEDPVRFLGSTGDRQLKSLEFAWYKISWNLSKFELIQTTLWKILKN